MTVSEVYIFFVKTKNINIFGTPIVSMVSILDPYSKYVSKLSKLSGVNSRVLTNPSVSKHCVPYGLCPDWSWTA